MARATKTTVRSKIAQCLCCGCTDAAACPDGCSWVFVDRTKGRGICSSCAPLIEKAVRLIHAWASRKGKPHPPMSMDRWNGDEWAAVRPARRPGSMRGGVCAAPRQGMRFLA